MNKYLFAKNVQEQKIKAANETHTNRLINDCRQANASRTRRGNNNKLYRRTKRNLLNRLQRCTFDSNVRRIVCNRAVSRCASVPKRATPQPSLCTDIRAHTYIANRIFLYGRDRNINEHCNNMLFIHDNNTAMAGRQKNSPQRIRVRVLYEERSFICCTLDLELEL
ncbi:unnamed protein product [Ceratitis capitata]|uniref:(Mediterranean fruit fly) hypothetical protein n=1 Tax=Ceratitis capitata TaxID=7213 RepID=A0A811VG98_CERCA|nr:unnamed protein product [Ceratitis capitata]